MTDVEEWLPMILFIAGLIIGGLITWLVQHIYYVKSQTKTPNWYGETPTWFEPTLQKFIKTLPPRPLSKQELLELFHDALEKGDIHPDPILGYVACPECKSSSSDFVHDTHSDDNVTVVVVKCPHCGWSDWAEV